MARRPLSLLVPFAVALVAAAAPPLAPDVPAGADAARDAELLVSAEAIYDAFVNTSGSLSPDGKTLLFSSNRDGLPQIYVADPLKPAAPARRLVTTTERTNSPQFTPDGKFVVFRADVGADENWSIWRVALDGTGLVELTPGEKLNRGIPILPEAAPRRMFFTARAPKESAVHLYEASTEPGVAPKRVYSDAAGGFLTDVSRDGTRAMLLRVKSGSDSTVVHIDLATAAPREIWPPPGKPELAAAGFSADGTHIIVGTDAGGESGAVVLLDATTFAEKARWMETTPARSRLDDVAVSRTGNLIAVRLNCGNRSELRLLDARTLAPRKLPKMPLGTGGSLSFSPDGRSLVLQWSTADAPFDLWALDTKSGKARRLRSEPRPSIAKLPKVIASIVEVTSFDGLKVPVNLYLPAPLPKGKKLPVLVSVHGGPASSAPVRWSSSTRFYSAHGFVVVEPNVRGSGGFGRTYEKGDDGPHRLDSVKDLEAVGRWAAAQPWADPARLVLMGGSYGGYMTLMGLAHHGDLWKAGVDLFGVYDWNTFLKTTAGALREIFRAEIGSELTESAFLTSVSPVSKVGAIAAPLFVYAGANDVRVPRSESDAIVASLRARKVPVEYMVAENEGHSLDRRETITSFLARSLRFLETNGIAPK